MIIGYFGRATITAAGDGSHGGAVEFRALGPVESWCCGQRLVAGTTKQRCLLALLLLDPNRVVSRDRLIDDLWEGTLPPSAAATLYSLVYRLRKALTCPSGTDPSCRTQLRSHRSGYVFEVPSDAIDLCRFEDLAAAGQHAMDVGDTEVAVDSWRAALDLWRGDAFADIDLSVVREHANRLDQRRLDVMELVLSAELDLGRHDVVVPELGALTVDRPLRERPWELLMTALHRAGRRAEALDAYQQLYRLLGEELGVSPSQSVRDLQQRILRAESACGVRLDLGHEARPESMTVGHLSGRSGSVPTPRQLPPDLPVFTGRMVALEQLEAALRGTRSQVESSTAVVISAIEGTAGIGKTSLAVHWAHHVADQFPDGQLYVNLRGFDPSGQVVNPSDAVRGFLDALGVSAEHVPVDLDAQTGLYRSLLAGRRILVVLDNAQDAGQVSPLLPSEPGCLALVTSRRQLSDLETVEGARLLTLDILTMDEARALLAVRLGEERVAAESKAVDEIIEHCARLPLALAIVAASAVVNPDFSVEALADEIRHTRRTLDVFDVDTRFDVRTVFSWSYNALRPAPARLFRLLGLHPGPDISLAAAGSLAGLPAGDIRPLLAELAEAHLINEHQPDRYTFHDLLRTYAAELANVHDSDDESRTTNHRLLDHHLHTAYACDRLLNPHRDSIPLTPLVSCVRPEPISDLEHARAWFTAEHAVLLAVVDHAVANGFDRQVWQLAWSLDTYFERHGHWQDWSTVRLAALDATERSGGPVERAGAHVGLARAYTRLGYLDDAHTHLDHALELYASIHDRAGLAITHHTLTFTLTRQGRQAEALRHSERALDLFQAIDHQVGHANALNAVGWYCAQLGNHREALVHCQRALELHREIGDRESEAVTWGCLGYAHHQLFQHEQAAACYEQAIQLFGELGNRFHVADTLALLGDTWQAAGFADNARENWRRALVVLEELGHTVYAEQIRAKLARLP